MTHLFEEAIAACIGAAETLEFDNGTMQVNARASFPESFVGFGGHFPGAPVLPAIVQLAAVRLLVERTVEAGSGGEQFSKTKFRGMVRPEEEIHLQVTIARSTDGLQGKFKITGEATSPVSSGNFVFSTLPA